MPNLRRSADGVLQMDNGKSERVEPGIARPLPRGGGSGSPWHQRWWARYGLAVASVCAGALLRWGLTSHVGEGLPTYITFYPAVVVTALLAGFWPGVVASASTILVVDLVFVCPGQFFFQASAAEGLGAILFGCMALGLCALTERYRRTRERAAAYEKELLIRQTREELHRHRESQRVTLSSIGDAVLTADTAGRITLLNPAAEKLTGWTEKEALGQPVAHVLNLIHPERRTPVEDLVSSVLRTGNTRATMEDALLVARDGRELAVQPCATPILEKADNPCGAVVVFRDVSGLRRTQQVVLQERDFVASVLDTAGALVVVFDVEGRILRFNRASEQASGYTFAEVRGRRLWDCLVSPEQADVVKAVIAELRANRHPNQRDIEWIAKNGERRRISWTHTCVSGNDGSEQFVVGVGIDLTAQRLAEVAYRKAADTYEIALHAGGLGTWDYDFTTGSVTLDERSRSIFGLTQGDRLDYDTVISLMHEADRPGVDQAVKAALSPDSTGVYAREYRVVWPDASIHWVAAKGRVYFQGEGSQRKPVRFIGTVQDITERRVTQETLVFLAHCGATPGENFFQSLGRFLSETLRVDFVCIDRLEGEAQTARTVAAFSDSKFVDNFSYSLKETPCGELVGKEFCCFEAGVRQRFPKDRMLQEFAAESYAGTTLRSHTGQPIGLIALIARRPLANQQLCESVLRQVAGRAAGELERQQTEQALRDNEERFLLAQQAGHVGVFEIDFQLNRKFWSAERKALFGVPSSFEPSDAFWSSLVHPADRMVVQDKLSAAFAARRPEVEQTYRVTLPDGQERWLEDRASISYDEAGRPVRLVGATTDVTAEVQAQGRAHQHRRQFRFSAVRTVAVLAVALFVAEALIMLALAGAPFVNPWWSILIDSVGLLVLVSPALYYLAFRPIVTILHQREQIEEALRRTNETLESRVEERTASLELANQQLESEIAERKKAESEVRRAKEEWERTFDSVPDLIAILDDQNRILRTNRAMAERLGLTPGQCVGLTCYNLVHGTNCPPDNCPHLRTLADGCEHSSEVFEAQLGGDFLITTTPLTSENGQQIGTVHVARDITARKRAEEALRKSQEDLSHAQAVAQVGSWRLNMQRNELVWSDETWRIFGVPKGTPLTYDTFLASVHPEDRNYVHARWWAALKGEPYNIEHRIVVGDTVKWVRERAELEFSEDGTLLGGFGTTQDITERKLAEEALRESEEQLRLVLEFSNDAVFWADADTGVIIRCNRKAEELMEMPREQLIGLHQSQLHPPGTRARELFAKAVSQAETENIETELLSKSGKRTPVLVNTSVITLSRRRVMQGVFRDISSRKIAERELLASEARFRALFEQAAVGVAQVETRTDRFVRVNQKYCDILGYSLGELQQMTLEQITHPEDLKLCRDKMGMVISGAVREFTIEKRALNKQGGFVWVSFTVSPLWQAGEEPAFHVAVVQDISQRKRVEAELEQARSHLEQEVLSRTAKLRESNQRLRSEIEVRLQVEKRVREAELRYRTVANFTFDMEYWRSQGGSLLYCSPSCERITGWSAEEFIANPDLLSEMVVPEDRPSWKVHEKEAAAQPGERTLQFRIRHKDGSLRWIEHACKSVISPECELMGVRASNRDITDRHLAEMETQRLRGELSRVSRITMAGQLTAAIAHELNQPLGAILCNAESAEKLLGLEVPDLEEVRSTLADIRDDTKRASAVIRRLRSLYGHSGRNYLPVNLSELIQETVGLLHSELVFKQTEVHLDLKPMPPVLGNATELQQVVLNLLLNALEAMSTGSVASPELRVSTYLEDGLVSCCIVDCGPGIPTERLDRLFEPFFTTKAKGMGMGLAISHSIIQAHNGRLWAENAPAGGAAFHFSLPQQKVSNQ